MGRVNAGYLRQGTSANYRSFKTVFLSTRYYFQQDGGGKELFRRQTAGYRSGTAYTGCWWVWFVDSIFCRSARAMVNLWLPESGYDCRSGDEF